MTTINVVFEIAGVDYGDCVQRVEIWQETLNGIGRWEVIADPNAGCAWPAVNTLTADSQVHIQIDDGAGPVTMMRGYLDDVLPYLDRTGHHTILYRITGRNRGMDLAQHYVSAEYRNIAADAIIGNAAGSLFQIIPSELTRITVGAAPPALSYEADRTYLADAVRDIVDLVDYDFYVDNAVFAGNANFNIFAHGLSPSGITLIDFPTLPGSTQNNILSVDPCGEEEGFNIKNYIEAHAGSLEDHYTDYNDSTVWVGTNCAITEDTVLKLNNKNSLKATCNAGAPAQITITLTFPNYSYGASIDLSEPCIGSYNYYMDDTLNAICRLEMILTDNGLNSILWSRSEFAGLAGGDRDNTRYPAGTGLKWRKVNFQLGSDSGIEPGFTTNTKGVWGQIAGVGVFNWSAVTAIEFTTTGVNVAVGDYFIVDGLSFPNHEVRAIQQDAGSIGLYGQRMKDFFRPDINSWYELNAYAIQKCDRLHDPKETIRVIAIGQTGTPYAAQTVEVVAPDFGIGGPLIGDTVIYRILRLHHRVVKNSDESNIRGYTFTTEYDLVRHQYYGTVITQLTEQARAINITDPVESAMRIIRLEEQHRRRSAKGVRLTP